MRNNVEIIISKYRFFTFYNQLLLGFFFLTLYVVIPFFLISLVDIIFEFSLLLRVCNFILLISIALYYVYKYFIINILRYFQLVKGYSDYEIAKKLISKEEIEDKALNYLELQNFDLKPEIVLNALNNYVATFNGIPVKSIIPKYFRFNKLKFYIVLIFVVIFIPLTFNQKLRIAQQRILFPLRKISYNVLNFYYLNPFYTVLEGENFNLQISVKGVYTPSQVFVRYGNADYRAQKVNDTLWTYTFENVRNNLKFYVHDFLNEGAYKSIIVQRIPKLIELHVNVYPPKYTDLEPFTVVGNGNFIFPENSKIEFFIKTINSKKCYFVLPNDTVFLPIENNISTLAFNSNESIQYQISLISDSISNRDLYSYLATVKKDLYPEIFVTSDNAEINLTKPILFTGKISDDYGFTSLSLIVDINGNQNVYNLPIAKNTVIQNFFYQFDIFDFLKNNSTEKIKIYFEVRDNDSFNGYKSTRSEMFEFSLPTKDFIDNQTTYVTNELKDKLKLSIDLINQLNVERKNLENRSKTQILTEWEKKQLNESLVQNYKEFQMVMQQILSLSQQLKNLNKFTDLVSDDIRKKNEEILNLFEKLMDNELSELIKNIAELKRDILHKVPEKNEKIISAEQLQKLLDRNLELLKRFEIENSIQRITQNLDQFATDLADAKKEEEREKIEEKIINTIEKHNEILEKNKELKKPFKINSFDENKRDILRELNKNNNDKNNTKDNYENSKRVKELSKMIDTDFQMNQNSMQAEDLENLRQLRSNLLKLSFAQEDNITYGVKYNVTKNNKNLLINQRLVFEQWNIIYDSLISLSSRNVFLGKIIEDDLKYIESYKKEISTNWNLENPLSTVVIDQKLLSHFNNLLLYIDEAIQRSEQELNSSGNGGGCPRPGKSKPSTSDIAKEQGNLKQSLKNMLNQLKNAKDGSMLSEQMGQFLSRQEMLNSLLQQILNSGNVGSQASEMIKEAQRLIEENIQDILNKRISNETILRHERIITRLLESEKAEKERKFEEKRESKENKKEFVRSIDFRNLDSSKTRSFDDNLNLRMLNLSKYYLDLYQYYINSGHK